MKQIPLLFSIMLLFNLNLFSQTTWGEYGSRTDYRDDAGLQGNSGAVSGFFQTYNPVNYPQGASSWWHLLDVRHSNPNNNYSMQFAGYFWDQDLYFRKTADNPSQPWSKVFTINQEGFANSSSLNLRTSNGQSFFTCCQFCGSYGYSKCIFLAKTDNSN